MIGYLVGALRKRLPTLPLLGGLAASVAPVLRQFPWLTPRGVIGDAAAWVARSQRRAGWFGAQRSDWHAPAHPASLQSYPPPPGGESFFRDDLFRRVPASAVFGLHGAYLLADEGVVLSRDNRVFEEFAHHFGDVRVAQGPLFRPFATFRPRVPRRKEWIALLAAPQCRNHYHWVFDVLPRVRLLEPYRAQIERFAVPGGLTPAQAESLAIAGIAEPHLLALEKDGKLYCERLIVPSLPGSVGAIPDWAIAYLRQRYGAAAAAAGRRRLYVARGASASRRLVNEAEVAAVLEARGFEPYLPERHGFAAQVGAFAEAEAVVGVHGAGLANLVFAPPGCRVLELFSPQYAQADCYFTLAHQVGLAYRFFLGTPAPTAWGDITVDAAEVARIVDGWRLP